VVELGVQRGRRQVEALAEAPVEDRWLVGLDGFHGDALEDRGAGWEGREERLDEREVAVCRCCHEQLGELFLDLGGHGEADAGSAVALIRCCDMSS